MSTEILTILGNQSPAVAIAGGFLWFLVNHTKEDAKERALFNTLIKEHMRRETEATLKLASKFQELADENRELRNNLVAVYGYNKEQRDMIREYEEANAHRKSKQRLQQNVQSGD